MSLATQLRHWASLAAGLTLIGLVGGCEPPERPLPVAANVSPCQGWPNDPPDLHANAEPFGLGCANRLNLRSMLDRPEDLQAGRPLGPASGARQVLAVEQYQQGKIAPFGPSSPTPKTTGSTGGTQ